MDSSSKIGFFRPSLSRLCVIVPCFNEEESLPVLVERLIPVLEGATGGDWRVLFVDDGSRDRTGELIWRLNASDARFMGLRLTRNFGHQPAVATALRFASGRAIGIIDCDLQDPPEVLIQLFREVESGSCDVCVGQRGRREEAPQWLRAAYKLFYRGMAAISEHDFTLDAGDFCVFNERVHRALKALPETMKVQRGLRSWVGFRQKTVQYQRPPRLHGSSKYNLRRLVRLALDNVVNFSTMPLRLGTWIGVSMIAFVGLAGVFFLLNRFIPWFRPFGYYVGEHAGTTTLVMLVSLLAAAGFVCLGIIGEYLALVVREVKARPMALVLETTGDLVADDKSIGPFQDQT